MKLSILLVFLLIQSTSAERIRYDGFKVLEFTPKTEEEVQYSHKLMDDEELDFWTDTRLPNQVNRLLLPSHKEIEVKSFLDKEDIEWGITDNNFQRTLEEEFQRLEKRMKRNIPGNNYNPDDFNTLEDIELEMREMVERCPQSVTCEMSSIGLSYEGRDIYKVTIKSGEEPKRLIWIDSAIHSREWLAPATVLRILDYMTSMYGEDAEVTELIDAFNWVFIPMMNPDGYVYSWDTDRNWRKSRNINENSSCVGTDLNRNYDVNWSLVGTSGSPCSNIYHGSSPASEPETVAVQNEVDMVADSLEAFLTYHTAATMWLIPWGHSIDGNCVYADDHQEMMAILDPTVDAIQNTHNDLVWPRGNSCATIYPTSGTTQDYAKQAAPTIPFVSTPELRGSGFVVPPESIQISFEENWNGLVEMVRMLNATKGK